MTARAIMAFVLQFGFVRLLLCCSLAVICVFGEDGLDDPGRLVRHGNRCEADWFSFQKLHDPRMYTFWVSTRTLNLRGHADHEPSSQVSVSLLIDASKARFTPARPVQRGNPKPGGKLASILELFAVADGSHNGRSGDGPTPGTVLIRLARSSIRE
jgi:hypothetical protein